MSNIPVNEHGDLRYPINDGRDMSDFRIETFSGYKKTDVKKELLQNISNNKIEPACYWSAELICSGHFGDVWEIAIFYLGKHIYNGNPKVAIYLQKRFQIFRNIMIQGMYTDELILRNNKTIRDLFAEIMVVLVSNPKKNGFELLKINKEEEFDMTQMPERLKASSAEFAIPIMHKKDPKEIFIAINEFTYHICTDTEHKSNMVQACYWLEWIIEFDLICKKRKVKCLCDRRYDIPVEAKYQCDIIWVVWDALFSVANTREQASFISTVLSAILDLFCIRFTSSCTKKRRYLLYFAISMLCEPFCTDQELVPDKGFLQNTLMHLPTIYKTIKESEVRPKTDYLFAGFEDQTNAEKSKQKMEWMNSVDLWSSG